MTAKIQIVFALLTIALAPLGAQEVSSPAMAEIREKARRRLEASLEELTELRERILAEKRPLMTRLGELETELSDTRARSREVARELNDAQLEVSNLEKRIASREEEADYVNGLLRDFVQDFEPALHKAEIAHYEEVVQEAQLAPENENLAPSEVVKEQADVLEAAVGRIEEAFGGTRLEAAAVDPTTGAERDGTFLLFGPVAVFRSRDAEQVGLVDVASRSLKPQAVAFVDPEHTRMAGDLVREGAGTVPLDVTLGTARRVAETEETFVEHVKKGGPVMVPIFVMAGIALVIALYKWISLSLVGRPSKRQLHDLHRRVEEGDRDEAAEIAARIKGPVGRMLQSGVRNLEEPKELIEEAMYEKTLTARLKLQRMLPFIAICAAAAPLLGLLGTVSGIINTFKQMMINGAGDAASVSGGISEALITTKFGLIVAIPSLLLHAFLSRKARGVIGQMELAAVAFLNRVPKRGRSSASDFDDEKADPDRVRQHVNDILTEMLGPITAETGGEPGLRN